MNKMLTHLNGYKREAVLAPLFKMLEATFDLFVPLVMADIVNVGIAAHDFHYILVRCGILLLLAVVGLACSLTAQYFSAKAAVGYSTSLRHALFEHIQRLGFTEMDTMGTSTLITRMTSDINQVQSGLNLFLRLFLRSPFVVVGAMIMAFTVNVRAAWIFVVAIPLLSVVVFGVMVITNPLYKTAQARLDRVLGLTRENLTGVRVVRAFDKEQDEIDRFENANDLLTRMQLHVGHLSALMSPLTYVIINIAIVALLYVGSIEINVGGMASGDVIALVNYMNQILIELVKLANLIVQVSKALACAGRVQAVLDTKPGMDFPVELRSEVPVDKAGDAVRFDHVSLTYAGAGAPSLSDISFTAKRGQTIGVIGGTGSGKSSLVNLIPRFYDPQRGEILLNGKPLKEYSLASLRRSVSMVSQDAFLFDMTIAENIAAIRARIDAAARLSGRTGADITLVAATKMNDAARVREAVAAGIDACGENRVQEMTEKLAEDAYTGAPLHFIGHLQTNKVRQVVGKVDLIQSVDSPELLAMIEKRAAMQDTVQDILLEVNIGGEAAKSGVDPDALPQLLQSAAACAHVRVRGLMAIPPVAETSDGNHAYFTKMHELFVDIGRKKYDNVSMDFLSMGMSGDFEDAIAAGANMVRVGSSIFGARDYSRH